MKLEALNDVTVVAESAVTINANNDKIATAFDNTLSRDGSSPNQMGADLDMNNNDILNVGSIDVDSLTINGNTVTDLVEAAQDAEDALAATLVAKAAVDASAASVAASEAYVSSVVSTLPDWKGPWVTATAYGLGDIVSESGNSYICVVAHTSGTFNTDLSAVKWQVHAAKGSAGAGTGDMLKTENLSGLANNTTARANLGVPGLATDADISANYEFQDSNTLRFGTDGDVKAYYDNTNAIFNVEPHNTPTAVLKMRFPIIELMKNGVVETMAKFIADGGVELYYDNAKKIETLAGGAKVTGDLQADTVSGTWLASSGDATTGTASNKLMTPERVKNALDDRFTVVYSNDGGRISFKPTAASANRIYFQWKRFTLAGPASSNQTVTWGLAFPTATLGTWVGVDNAASQMIGCHSHTNSTVVVQKGSGDVGIRTGWVFGVGY